MSSVLDAELDALVPGLPHGMRKLPLGDLTNLKVNTGSQFFQGVECDPPHILLEPGKQKVI